MHRSIPEEVSQFSFYDMIVNVNVHVPYDVLEKYTRDARFSFNFCEPIGVDDVYIPVTKETGKLL